MPDTEQWLSDTRRVVAINKNQIAVNIKKDIAEALELKPGTIVEIRIRNTGLVANGKNTG